MSRSRFLRLFWRAPRTRMASREASVIPSPLVVSGEARPGSRRSSTHLKGSMEYRGSPCVRRWMERYGDAVPCLQIPGAAIQYYLPRSPVQGVAPRRAKRRCRCGTRTTCGGFSARRYNPRRLNVLAQGECRMSSRVLSGVALAAAAAVMFSTVAVSTARADEGKVKCEGVNSCKGHSACKSANNACKGQNSCKGKGFVEMTQAQCDAAKAKMKAGG